MEKDFLVEKEKYSKNFNLLMNSGFSKKLLVIGVK